VVAVDALQKVAGEASPSPALVKSPQFTTVLQIQGPSVDVEMLAERHSSTSTGTDDEALREREEVRALVEARNSVDEEVHNDVEMSIEPELHEEDRPIQDALAVATPSMSPSPGLQSSQSGLDLARVASSDRSTNSLSRRSSRISSHSTGSEDRQDDVFDEEVRLSGSVPASRSTTPEEQGSLVVKTLGGFPAFTWTDLRKAPETFRPKIYHSKDLPHSLQDNMNRLPESAKMLQGNRTVYEAMILENSMDEHLAPITISNDVDDEPNPPWEFYYTNEMWYGEGVPDPDIKSLVSCDCEGECNPKSKTCACLKRQREFVGPEMNEFAYDKNGKLKVPQYPIFECNYLCGCSEGCRNRVSI